MFVIEDKKLCSMDLVNIVQIMQDLFQIQQALMQDVEPDLPLSTMCRVLKAIIRKLVVSQKIVRARTILVPMGIVIYVLLDSNLIKGRQELLHMTMLRLVSQLYVGKQMVQSININI